MNLSNFIFLSEIPQEVFTGDKFGSVTHVLIDVINTLTALDFYGTRKKKSQDLSNPIVWLLRPYIKQIQYICCLISCINGFTNCINGYFRIFRGDSSVGRLLCVCLVERFAVRISPLAFFADTLYMCCSQKNTLARLYRVFLSLPDRCVCGGI